MIGPNMAPMVAVPRRWMLNRPTKIRAAIGTTKDSRWGAAISRPSTAESTEIAGVIIPSPYSRAVPNSPRRTRPQRTREFRDWAEGRINEVSARIPPSPSLSARSTKARYLRDTTMISDHTISEITPRTVSRVTARPSAATNACRKA